MIGFIASGGGLLALRRLPIEPRPPPSQSGNIFFALFGALAMVGVLGAAAIMILKGPVRGMHHVMQDTVVKGDMIAATALLSEYSLSSPTADCDEDGMIEPVAFKTVATLVPAPIGGGFLPDAVGANKTDPWKSLYGYCAWDHGTAAKAAGCGGAGANRLAGGNVATATATAIAVLSAGPDRVFQTSCSDFVAEGTPVVSRPSGSDDIVKEVAYASFLVPRMANAKIGELPEEACTPETIGTMRVELGVVQICMDTGWEEIGTSAQASGNFIPVENAALGDVYTSNQVSFSGFLNKKTVTVDGAATLLINGVVTAAPAQIESGDYVQLRAAAPLQYEQTLTFSASISGVKKTWTITSRDRTPANLLISPSPVPDFIIDGESGTAYSDTAEFMLTNIGEERAVISAPLLDNASNFEITETDCAAARLALNESCTIMVRAKAAATGGISGSLNIHGAGEHYGGSFAPSASLSGDALFPVVLADATAVDLSALPDFAANGRWASNRPKRVIVPAGVIVGSTSAAVPAMRTGTGWGGSLSVTVNGEIHGAGGEPNGGAGGTAFLAEASGVRLINNGAIRAGGGAGGKGGNGGGGSYNNPKTVTEGPYYSENVTQWIASGSKDSGDHNTGYTFILKWSGSLIHHESVYQTMSPAFMGYTSYTVGSVTYSRGSLQRPSNVSGGFYSIYRQYTSSETVNTSGGAGGNGGRGQGYDGTATGSAALDGAEGVTGGTNGGKGGKGGTGGTWGANGTGGAAGASGNNGAGTAGTAGGPAGWAVENSGNVTYSGGGDRQGRV